MSEEKESTFRVRRDFGISDVLVDFLGALFPGLLFSLSIALTIGSSLGYLIHQANIIIRETGAQIENINALEVFQYLSKGIGIGNFSFYFIVLFLIASYVLGQFLFRKDPKDADTASFRRVWKNMDDDKRKKWVEQLKSDEKISTFIAEYPYRFLKVYLDERGLQHLSKIVPWSENDFETRSKTFINLLKIRINFFHPDKMRDILKNEGHIRLMSSIWYLLKYLRIIAIWCLIGNCLFFSIGLFWTHQTLLYCGVVSLLSGVILSFAFFGKKVIESFIHYQRVREVFYVLETAFTTSIKNEKILANIEHSKA